MNGEFFFNVHAPDLTGVIQYHRSIKKNKKKVQKNIYI